MSTVERRRWAVSLALGLGISAVFLYLLVRRLDLAAVSEALGRVSLPVLSLALLTRGGAFLAMGLRSKVTTAPGGDVALRTLTLSHLLGFTGNNVLPLRLGELLRIDYVARASGLSRSFLLGTVASERLLDSVVLLAVFAATVPAMVTGGIAGGSFPFLVAATAFGFLVAVLLVRWPSFPRLAGSIVRPLSAGFADTVEAHSARLVEGFAALSRARWAPAAFGATLLYWSFGVGSVTIVMTAAGLGLPWYTAFGVLAVTALGTALPASPGFVGTYHYFAALGVSLLGVDPPTAASYAIVAHAMAIVPYTLVGLVVFARSIRVWLGSESVED